MGYFHEELVVLLFNYCARYLFNPKPKRSSFLVQYLNLDSSLISVAFLFKFFGLANWALCPMTTAFLERFLVLSDSGWTGNTTKNNSPYGILAHRPSGPDGTQKCRGSIEYE